MYLYPWLLFPVVVSSSKIAPIIFIFLYIYLITKFYFISSILFFSFGSSLFLECTNYITTYSHWTSVSIFVMSQTIYFCGSVDKERWSKYHGCSPKRRCSFWIGHQPEDTKRTMQIHAHKIESPVHRFSSWHFFSFDITTCCLVTLTKTSW